jgi:hypothetical protein
MDARVSNHLASKIAHSKLQTEWTVSRT